MSDDVHLQKLLSILEMFDSENVDEIHNKVSKTFTRQQISTFKQKIPLLMYIDVVHCECIDTSGKIPSKLKHVSESYILFHKYRMILLNALIRKKISFKEFQERMNYNLCVDGDIDCDGDVGCSLYIHDTTKYVWIYSDDYMFQIKHIFNKEIGLSTKINIQ